LARSDVASQDNRIIGLRLQRTKAIQSLEALLGRTPSGQLSLPEELPDLPAMPGTGLPSELLQRRPDLLAVERRLKAADQDAMVAYKARFPRFSLNSSVGARSEDVDKLLDLESMIWSLGVNLTQPLWNGTELEANLEQANIQTRLVALDYNRILLNALQEVEAALSAETLLAEQEAAIRRSATEARNAEDIAEEQYVLGLVSFVTVLEAQRRAFDARSALIQVRSDRLQNRIQLHLALGGDFALPAQPPASG
jgi:outer membrane protein TolC